MTTKVKSSGFLRNFAYNYKITTMIKSINLVVKSNQLVEARYKLSLWESRVFAKMVTMIQKDDKDFTRYEIDIRELMRFFETTAHNDYDRIKKVPELLLSRKIKIPIIDDGKEAFLIANMISGAIIPRNEEKTDKASTLKLSFHPDLKPYLLELKKKFLKYDIKNIMRISSPHSIRMYELLKQYEKIGYRLMTINEIKAILGIDGKYKRYSQFKERIIKLSQRDLLKHTDIGFNFEELKKGRAIYAIKFLIYKNELNQEENKPKEAQTIKQIIETIQMPQEPSKQAPFKIDQKAIESEAMGMMLKEGIIYDVAVRFLKKYDNETELIQELRYIKKELGGKHNILNKPALMVKMLEEQNFKKQRLYKAEKEKAAQKQKQAEIEWHKEQIEGLRQEYKNQRNQAVMAFINKIGKEQTALLVEKYKKDHPTTCQAIENAQQQGDKKLAHDYKCGLFAKELENESLHDFYKYLAINHKYKIVIIEGVEYLFELK